MHVVDQVRGDEGERGQLARRQVAGEPPVGHVEGGAATEPGEVWRRVVPNRVLSRVGLVAVRGHRLLVRLPRLPLAEDAGRRGNAAPNGVAVAVEPRDAAVPEA